MLAEADVHPGEHEVILADLHAGRAERVLERLCRGARRARARCATRGLQLAVCSNWDWDLEPAIAEAGLDDAFDVVVSSAWAGARKPHPRIFRHTLDAARARPGRGRVRRRHVGSRRRGPARGGHARGLPRARRPLARHDADPPTPAASSVVRIRDLAGSLPRCCDVRRRCGDRCGVASDDADVLRLFTLPAGADVELDRLPLFQGAVPVPWIAEKWTNTSGPSSREMKP